MASPMMTATSDDAWLRHMRRPSSCTKARSSFVRSYGLFSYTCCAFHSRSELLGVGSAVAVDAGRELLAVAAAGEFALPVGAFCAFALPVEAFCVLVIPVGALCVFAIPVGAFCVLATPVGAFCVLATATFGVPAAGAPAAGVLAGV